MQVADLIEDFRTTLDDVGPDPFFSNEKILQYLNEAESECTRRGRLLTDSTTPEICTINVVAGTSVYDLDKRIISVERVISDYNPCPIYPIKVQILDKLHPGWNENEGTITNYVLGMDKRKLRLYPTPDTDQTITLTVLRLPLVKMEDQDDEPEIDEMYHQFIVYYALHRAYSVADREIFDNSQGAKFLNMFEAEFGEKKSASALEEEFWFRHSQYLNDGRV